jgi:hypothetical protein
MKPLTRKQAREALDQVPLDQVLGVPGELTHKQREFARLVALGETGSGAYRKAYKAKGKPTTAAVQACKLKTHPSIAQTIEAFKLANEAQAYQTPAQLRALVLHSLVQVIIDPDAKHATKVQAAKVLGTVTEVAAFTERRETRIIKSSEDAKAQVLAKLREVLKGQAEDAQVIDAESLLVELTGGDANPAQGEAVSPTPQNAVWSPTQTMHSNVDTQSAKNLVEDTPHSDISSLESELAGETPPVGDLEQNPGGDISGNK